MALKAFRTIILLIICCGQMQALNATPKGTSLTYQQQSEHTDFNTLYRGYQSAVKAQQKATALTYLSRIENLLTDLRDGDPTTIRVTLAYGYAQLGEAKKARLYQKMATQQARGKIATISVSNVSLLAESYLLLKDSQGMKTMFDNVISRTPKTEKPAFQIAYVHNLFIVNDNPKARQVLSELYSSQPIGVDEKAEMLSLLLINSFKLNQLQRIDQYYNELNLLKAPPIASTILARGMYSAFKNKYGEAFTHYRWLWNGLRRGKKTLPYLEGTLQLANLNSISLQKDSAEYYFTRLRDAIPKPIESTAIGLSFLKTYRLHQLRFKMKGLDLSNTDQHKDSLFQAELISTTKALTSQHQLEVNKQKAAMEAQERQLEQLAFAKRRQQLVWTIVCLSLLVIGGGLIIYLFTQKRKQAKALHLAEMARLKQLHHTDLIKKLAASQEAERWRIADQLHDEVGSMISVVRLNLSAHPLKNEVISAEKLDTANRVLADVADTVREMSHQLMPVAIRQYGLIKAIEQLISDINTAGKIYIEHLIHGFEDVDKYPEDFQISFYRIIQELFQNIVKHAKATNAIFQLVEHPDSINLYIEDNGRGIDTEHNDKTGKGIGLLANRIDYFEGHISIEGSPGKGTLIVIDIPTKHMIEAYQKENH